MAKEAFPTAARIAYICVAMVVVAASASMLTYRLRSIAASTSIRVKSIKPLHLITMSVYTLGCLFALSATISIFGVGITRPQQCHGAIIMCTVFYLAEKFMLYAFLIERIHVVRARTTLRRKNPVYVVSLVTIIAGFTFFTVLTSLQAVSEYYEDHCDIGLPAKIALPLLTYDIVVNFSMTIIFLYHVRPYLNGSYVDLFSVHNTRPTSVCPSVTGEHQSGTITLPQLVLRKVLRKTFWGSLLIMPSTVANMTVFAVMKGHQAGWACAVFCNLDG
jgi:hypothetical protein